MHAYLLISVDESLVSEKVKQLFPEIKQIINYKIEKISDTKELIKQTNVSLNPTVYLINDFDDASVEAQNAFLKRLEEPQDNLSFVLTAKKEDRVLPTIISRCRVIRLTSKKEIYKADEDLVLKFLESDISGKFGVILKITKREDAVEFLEKIIINANKIHNIREIKQADMTLSRINQNANPTLQLTNFVLSL